MDNITVVSNSTSATQAVAPKSAVDASVNANNEEQEQQDTGSESENDSDENAQDSDLEQNLENAEDDDLESDDSENSESEDDQEGEEQAVQTEVKKKKIGGYKGKALKLQSKLSERDQRIAFLEGQLAIGNKQNDQEKNQQQQQQQVEVTDKPVKPKQDDPRFKTVGDYLDALDNYNEQMLEWRFSQETKKQQKAAEDKNAADAYNATLTKFHENEANFKKTAKDFDKVVKSVDDVILQPALMAEIFNSDMSAQLRYELSKDRKELVRINSLTSVDAIKKAVAKFEGKLEFAQAAKKQIHKKTITSAGAPITPLRGTSSLGKKTIDDPSLTQAEYEALRRQK